jgi:pimeloyl-ACP methyl ester carboxylesterase
MLPFGRGSIEIWTRTVGATDWDDVDVFVLKFSGTAGRAERATYHPMDYWTDLRAELWSFNPPGYGGSTGTASLNTLAAAAATAYRELADIAQGRPIIVMGNSLGTVAALYLSANFPVAGLVLRNPPPVRQLIVGRHGWWNLWVASWLIAQRVPRQICSISNAARSHCPAVFLSSRRDKTVPPQFHDRIIDAYRGPHRVLELKEAEHATSLNLEEQRQYAQHLDWLRDQSALVSQNVPKVTRLEGESTHIPSDATAESLAGRQVI